VNDAPALKQADCGVALSGATDAARSAAALVLTAPGLSTIVNAIVEARKIFERINSYVYYRIAMTIAIMLVVVLSSVIFNIQPLTAIMIVALALLDDIPIMTIAYDNVRAAPTPVRWDMHRTLILSGLMGLMATAQSFGLVFLGMEWMNDPAMMAKIPLDHSHLQTMLFLQLAAGGHMLLFVVRSRGSMISPPLPSAPLLLAIVATQIAAVLTCAYGVLVPALPWGLIGIVWVYVIGWTIITDLVKLVFNNITAPPAQEIPLTAHALALRYVFLKALFGQSETAGRPGPDFGSPQMFATIAAAASVQLAPVFSEAEATGEWRELQNRLPDLLGEREPVVRRVVRDGAEFWLLRIGGFVSKPRASEFCNRLRAKGYQCEVITAE
jgi:H+-transporting ATPase